MMRTILLILMLSWGFSSFSQVSVDNFVGTWCVLNITEVNVNDTVSFFKQEYEKSDENYLVWELKSDTRFKRSEFQTKDSTGKSHGTMLDIWTGGDWKYFKETKVLFLASEKYNVLNISSDELKVVRIK